MDTKALRQKILDLAIRGKLVPQDPNDEPASVLLERICAEKQQMVKDGKLKAKDIKNDTVIFKGEDNLHYEKFPDGTVKCIKEEIPFDVPDAWSWSRLENCCCKEIKRGKSPKYAENGSTLVFAQKCNTKYDGINIGLSLFLDDNTLNKYPDTEYMQNNDIVINSTGTGTLGRVGIYKDSHNAKRLPIVPDSHVTIIRAYKSLIADYVYTYMKAKQPQIEKMGEGSTNQKELKPLTLKKLLICIPPFPEQHRITEKLTELISFIDTIETGKLNLKETIQATKSKILDLAIRGKLVPQDPNDEPASVLLERIRTEKEELIKQGKIKRDKKESVIFKGEDNSYYLKIGNLTETLDDWRIDDIPDSWGVCCLGEVCDYGNCTNVDTKDIPETAWILDLEDIEKDTGKVLQKLTLKERNSASTKHSFHKGQVLYSKLRPYLNKVVLADDEGYCTSEILPLDFNDMVYPKYARYYLMSPTFLKYANYCSYGVKMPRLGTNDGKKAILTVPPLQEQHRIVNAIETIFAKLDEIANALS